MKFLALIFLFISLAATFVPCCEFDNCADEQSATSAHQEEEEEAGCSPLSTCNRCSSGAIIGIRTLQVDVPIINKSEFKENDISSVQPSYFPSFWQPPRLS